MELLPAEIIFHILEYIPDKIIASTVMKLAPVSRAIHAMMCIYGGSREFTRKIAHLQCAYMHLEDGAMTTFDFICAHSRWYRAYKRACYADGLFMRPKLVKSAAAILRAHGLYLHAYGIRLVPYISLEISSVPIHSDEMAVFNVSICMYTAEKNSGIVLVGGLEQRCEWNNGSVSTSTLVLCAK